MKLSKLLHSFLLAAGSSLLGVSSVHAASGTWLGASGDWSTAGTWSGGTVADGVDSTANFTGVNITADQIITLDAARTIGNITFTDATTASNNLTISGANILTLDRSSGAPVIDVTQTGRTLTISSQVSGADGLQKNGTGTLTLSGNNNYTGVTTISAGNLVISHNNALGSTAQNTTITAAGTGPRLLLSGGINSAENISIGGSTESGSYDNVFSSISGTNTLSGNITLASPSGGIRLGTNGGNLILAGTINQSGGAQALYLNASVGDITVNNAISNGTAALNIISQAASGSVTLKAAQGAGGIGAVTIGESGVLKLGITNALRTNQNLTLGFSYEGTPKGTFDLAGFNQTVNALATNGTTATNSSRVVTNSAASGTSTLTVSSGTFNGVINDGATAAVALTKTSTGTLNLSGNSNYSGVTAINAGTITISQANALGSTTGNTTIAYNGSSNASGGLLRLSNGITTAENITITGAEGGSYLGAIGSSSGTSTFSGTITLTASSPGASIRLGGDGTTIFSGNITQTGTAANLALYKTNTVNNPIAINGNALIVIGGTSILKGVSGSGIGTTIISQTGVLQLGVTDALNTANDLEIGWYGTETGTLNLASYNQTIRGLTSASTGATRSVINSVVSTNSTLTVGNGGGTYTFSGTILNNTGTGGTVALVKTGAGTQTLSGVNTYTGGTRIDNGTLTLGHATNTLANTGAVNVNGGTLALGTNSDTVGAVTLTSGFITSSTGVLTGTSYAVESGTVSGILGGSGALSKSTTGTVTISNTQTYSGATTVSAGTLYVTGTLSNSAVTVQADGTIGRNGATTGGLGNGLTIQAGGKLDLTGATLGADSAAILGITSGNLTLGNLAFTDLIGWDYTNAALGTYELIDGGFTVDFGSTAYTNPMNAFSFGNGKFGYFTSGSLNAVIIPEPSVALLGGLGLLALLRRRR